MPGVVRNLQSTFEIGDILNFTHSAYAMVIMWLEERSRNLSEVQWPNLYHIVNVFTPILKELLV